MTPASRAAVDTATGYCIRVENPLLLQETNNTVVWLRPSDVIAKVGTHPASADGLVLEHEVARALAALGRQWPVHSRGRSPRPTRAPGSS